MPFARSAQISSAFLSAVRMVMSRSGERDAVRMVITRSPIASRAPAHPRVTARSRTRAKPASRPKPCNPRLDPNPINRVSTRSLYDPSRRKPTCEMQSPKCVSVDTQLGDRGRYACEMQRFTLSLSNVLLTTHVVSDLHEHCRRARAKESLPARAMGSARSSADGSQGTRGW